MLERLERSKVNEFTIPDGKVVKGYKARIMHALNSGSKFDLWELARRTYGFTGDEEARSVRSHITALERHYGLTIGRARSEDNRRTLFYWPEIEQVQEVVQEPQIIQEPVKHEVLLPPKRASMMATLNLLTDPDTPLEKILGIYAEKGDPDVYNWADVTREIAIAIRRTQRLRNSGLASGSQNVFLDVMGKHIKDKHGLHLASRGEFFRLIQRNLASQHAQMERRNTLVEHFDRRTVERGLPINELEAQSLVALISKGAEGLARFLGEESLESLLAEGHHSDELETGEGFRDGPSTKELERFAKRAVRKIAHRLERYSPQEVINWIQDHQLQDLLTYMYTVDETKSINLLRFMAGSRAPLIDCLKVMVEVEEANKRREQVFEVQEPEGFKELGLDELRKRRENYLINRILKRVPTIRMEIKEWLESIAIREQDVKFPVSLDQLSQIFPGCRIVIDYVKQAQNHYVISPIRGYDHHPQYTEMEVLILRFFKYVGSFNVTKDELEGFKLIADQEIERWKKLNIEE